MMKIDPFKTQAFEIAQAVRSGVLTPEAAVEPYLNRIKSHAKELNTHIFFDQNDVDNQLATLRDRLASKSESIESLRLAGVPILVKDNISIQGTPTTCGSKILGTYKPPFDATAIARLRAAGAIFLGKTNMDEFGMGSSNENSFYGPVKNPWNKERVPGGSSGGSAAGIAAGFAPVALGTDTGGSIRQPASFCGVVGMKPTYGRISRYGLIAYGSSLDQIGPLTHSVRDAALVTDVMSGADENDSTSRHWQPTDAFKSLQTQGGQGVQGRALKIGVIKELLGDGLNPQVRRSFDQCLSLIKEAGHEVSEVSIPSLKFAIACYYVIATAEASSNLSRFDGIRYGIRQPEASGSKQDVSLDDVYVQSRSQGFGREVKQRIMLGTFSLTSGYFDAYYAQATKVRALIQEEFHRAFANCDALISPTSPTTAFGLGEKIDDPLAMYLNDICTTSANLAKIPGLSLPIGFDDQSLPIGLQVLAAEGNDELLFQTSLTLESLNDFMGGRHAPC
jgi:aspartyl-tRNA(Asn)/glutamyl-tRNA(Gln) amidotransferase subunit A